MNSYNTKVKWRIWQVGYNCSVMYNCWNIKDLWLTLDPLKVRHGQSNLKFQHSRGWGRRIVMCLETAWINKEFSRPACSSQWDHVSTKANNKIKWKPKRNSAAENWRTMFFFSSLPHSVLINQLGKWRKVFIWAKETLGFFLRIIIRKDHFSE